jgi:hypothetical protein
MCLKGIVLHAQNMMTTLGSIINKFGEDLYEHLLSIIIFTLKKEEKNIHMRSKTSKMKISYAHASLNLCHLF